jgi:hypothetical protein
MHIMITHNLTLQTNLALYPLTIFFIPGHVDASVTQETRIQQLTR